MAQVHWPEKYQRANTKVFVSNQLVIPADPKVIWAWLVRAARWPEWYPNSSDVRLPSGLDLAPGMQFQWTTFGVSLISTIREFEPYSRIAWDGHATGIDVYHAWVLEKTGPGKTLVLTEESQNGWLARLSNFVMPNRMSRYHQLWLERLSERAQSGLP